jgi:hypothetical protein
MQLKPEVVAKHKQLYENSCIPMAIEYVLKLLGRIPPDDFRLQEPWGNKDTGNFRCFNGQTIEGVRFRQQFARNRDEHFPLDELFSTIESELAAGRYVIISLEVPGPDNGRKRYHNFVIYDRMPNGEFRAASKVLNGEDRCADNVREWVGQMNGTDILTYECST